MISFMMSDQYVFELHYKGKTDYSKSRENRENPLFVIMDGESMTEFSKLQRDLKKCIPEPFNIQYVDSDDDIVSIDTEDEFKEFAKIAKQRSSRGLVIRLVLNSTASTDPAPRPLIPLAKKIGDINQQQLESKEKVQQKSTRKVEQNETFTQEEMEEALGFESIPREKEGTKNAATYYANDMLTEAGLMELKEKIKSEVKEEILREMRNKKRDVMKPGAIDLTVEDTGYEEDSDGNLVCPPDERRVKLLHCQKKLQKKEKQLESKLDQRLEKLEMKKRKLVEKASSLKSTVNRKIPRVGLPFITSGVQGKDCGTLAEKITIGSVFAHKWQIFNDGTTEWTNVEIRHFWSTPGLETVQSVAPCPCILPGKSFEFKARFQAPRNVGAFKTFWFLYQLVDSQWKQFGHYISLTGYTIPPNRSDTSKDVANKISKQEPKTVTFGAGSSKVTQGATASAEAKAVEDTVNMRRLEAKLASAVIAAEMTREAANAAIRYASGKQAAATRSITNGLDKQERTATIVAVEEVTGGVQTLNVVDSSSDTEANNDNEETDPGFVMVDVPSCFRFDGRNSQSDDAHQVAADLELPKKINQVTTSKDNDKLTTDSQVQDKETKKVQYVPPPRYNDIYAQKEAQPENKIPERLPNAGTKEVPFSALPEFIGHKINVQEQSHPENKMPEGLPYAELDEQPFSLPRLDQNVNYPVFPPRVPVSLYTPPQPIPHHHAPHGYPVFPPQNPSPHPIVFPQPINYFTAPKMNPPVHYPQIPTYPPMPAPSHPIPLISSGFSTAMPAQSAMAPPQIPPPQMNPAGIPKPIVGAFPIPVPIVPHFGCENPSSQSAPAATSDEGKICSTDLSLERNLSSAESSSATAVTESSELKDTVSEPKEKQKPVEKDRRADGGVQILPQSLVDGAINVAATAYSTAWNALSNLRQKDGDAVEFDPVFENNMAILVEMGFNNLERNALLLKRFNNDVSQVIGVLCATGGADHMNIN